MKIGSSTFNLIEKFDSVKYDGTELINSVELISQLGLHVAELTLDVLYARPNFLAKKVKESLLDLKQQRGLEYSVHLPFSYVDLASLDERIRRASIESIYEVLDFSQDLEVDTFILHVAGGSTTKFFLAKYCSKQTKSNFLKEIEDVVIKSVSEIVEFVSPVSLCVDIGHVILQGEEDVFEFFDRFYDRIKIFHLHDVANLDWGLMDHRALGKGFFDFRKFLNELNKKEYSGPVILELFSKEDTMTSLDAIRSLVNFNPV